MNGKREGKPSKVVLLWRDLLSELYSWSRWLYFYLLPSWLSFPFQYSAGKILYLLALVALLLVYIPVGPFRLFVQEAMVDLWKKVVGENSATALSALLQSFPPGWVFLSIVFIGLWGLIVRFWAWRQYTFFKLIGEAGIRVVRAPGRRLAFLNRLQKGGVSGLGLGPTARLLPIYISRKEDFLLRQKMRAYKKERLQFGLLITGIATSGKTRTAMELIADIKPSLVFIWPRGLSINSGLNVPTWGGSAILFADNLTLSASSGGVPLSSAMLQLLQQNSQLILIGTIRRNLVPRDLRNLEAIELSEIQEEDGVLQYLAQYVADMEADVKGEVADGKEVMRRYNGHPAGLVAGVEAMSEIYEQLETNRRAILRSAKLLRLLRNLQKVL